MKRYEACCPDLRRDGILEAVAGDIIGSVYEFHPIKSTDFPLFGKRSEWTDDSVLTMAVAETLLTDRPYKETMREFALENSDAGFGGMFRQWFTTQGSKPYNSFGNGSAMRVSPVGWAFQTLDETLAEAQRSAEVTHNHPEGIKGAQSVAAATFLARKGLRRRTSVMPSNNRSGTTSTAPTRRSGRRTPLTRASRAPYPRLIDIR
jgi:ADP-ribosylglycohydrolase